MTHVDAAPAISFQGEAALRAPESPEVPSLPIQHKEAIISDIASRAVVTSATEKAPSAFSHRAEVIEEYRSPSIVAVRQALYAFDGDIHDRTPAIDMMFAYADDKLDKLTLQERVDYLKMITERVAISLSEVRKFDIAGFYELIDTHYAKSRSVERCSKAITGAIRHLGHGSLRALAHK